MKNSNVSQSLSCPPLNLKQEREENKRIPAKKVNINSNKLKVLREMDRKTAQANPSHPSTRNILAGKLSKINANGRKTSIKVITRSMGMGTPGISLTPETDTARVHGGKDLKKRTHSEAVMTGLITTVKKLKVGDEILDLSEYKLEYTASSNQPCSGVRQQNCTVLAEVPLAPMYFGNIYHGTQDAHGFTHARLAHDLKIAQKGDPGYSSEPDSDDETVEKRTVVINSHSLHGRDFAKNNDPIPAIDFKYFYSDYDTQD